jgi:RsiW-degrading membrane proteinase PrsW (M82 family)
VERITEVPAPPLKTEQLPIWPVWPPVPAAEEFPLWRRHLHWLLVLALIPLALSVLGRDDGQDDFARRVRQTMEDATPEQREHALRAIATAGDDEGALEAFFDALPDRKLAGAWLPRDSWLHWGLAAGAGALFMGFFLLLARRQTAEPLHLIAVGLFTATIGVLLLLAFQKLADWSQDVVLVGRSPVVILFYAVKFIGFSYRAALDPGNGFVLSFVGYTFGVGLCEELAKALPLIWLYRRPCDQGWRGAFVWGLVSGAGFGLAEAVMYAGGHYNGISGSTIYLVRFISCVALHAVWTGSVGITLNRRQELLHSCTSWYEWILPLLRVVAVPVVLHGLYDTLLKKGMDVGALAVAVLSFLLLAYQINRLHATDRQAHAGSPSALG